MHNAGIETIMAVALTILALAAVAGVVVLLRVEKRLVQLVGQQDTLNRVLGSEMWTKLVKQVTDDNYVDEV